MGKSEKDILKEQKLAKLSNLDGVLKTINKKYGKGTISKFGDAPYEKIQSISTGSLHIDKALGVGGIPKGRVIEIFGPESSGKTTLTLHTIAERQKQGGICAFIDAEHALDPEYASNLGVNMDELFLSQPDYGEQALEVTEEVIRSGSVDLVIIDSVAALTPKAEIDGDMEDMQVGLQARMMSKALRKITAAANQMGTTVIFINQIRMKIGVTYGSPETTSGGNALKFFASVRIDIRRTGSEKKTVQGEEVIYANNVKIKIIKNKVRAPFKVANTKIFFGEGFRRESEIMDIAVKRNIVEKAGSWYSYGDLKLGQGEEKSLNKLKEDEALFAEVEAKVLESINPPKEDKK